MQVSVAPAAESVTAIGAPWRQVFCVIEHEHKDLTLANAACEGTFTNAGETIAMGSNIDWRSPKLPQDEEWRIEWHKFYVGLDLAYAYATTTRAEKYRATWRRLVLSWIAQMPVGCDSSDVAARRIQNWIYAWNSFSRAAESPGFDTEFENRFGSSLVEQVAHLRLNLTPERNHRTLELYALFIAALALPELDQQQLLAFAIAELQQNLLDDIRPDGVHRELSTHYHMIALRSFLGARENARRFGLEFSAAYDHRLIKACEFMLHVQRPDGSIPALSDADTGNYTDLLKLASELFQREDFLFAATAGAQGAKPKATAVGFPAGGYFVQRSGWGRHKRGFGNERHLVFDCGPLGDGGHGHYDLLNIEVFANGHALIVDPGRFTYAEDAFQWRRYFKGTAAHNTVSIDDLDQTPYRGGKPKGPIAQGCLRERLTEHNFDMLLGEAHSPVYDTIHTRRIFFVAGEYWLVVDSLRGEIARKFDLRFHLNTDAWNCLARITEGLNAGLRTPRFALLFEPQTQLTVEPGWISEQYGIKERAPIVSVVKRDCSSADFFTLIVPLGLNTTVPHFVVQKSDDPLKTGVVQVHGIGPDLTAIDHIAWSEGNQASLTRSLSCLAPDNNLPQRDQLLDDSLMARRLSSLLGRDFSDQDCRRSRTKYRPGISLRALYEIAGEQETIRVATRAFPRKKRRTASESGSCSFFDSELNTGFWVFPADRKIQNLSILREIPDELADIDGKRWVRSRVMAHAPEKSVTVQCLSSDDEVLAYAKIYSPEASGVSVRIYDYVRERVNAAGAILNVPRALNYSRSERLLLLEAINGVRLSALPMPKRERAMAQLGEALRQLHGISTPRFLSASTRHTPDNLLQATRTIIKARPELATSLAPLTQKLITEIASTQAGKQVLIHGDVHPKNVLLTDRHLFLLDLDQAARGPAVLDVAGVLAGINYDCCIGEIDLEERKALTRSFLSGYKRIEGSLRWHVAAAMLEERALRAVTRVRLQGLRVLPKILDEASRILTNGGEFF